MKLLRAGAELLGKLTRGTVTVVRGENRGLDPVSLHSFCAVL